MRLVLFGVFSFGQMLEVFIRLGYRARDDIRLGSPGPEVDGFAASAAKREVLPLPGSPLPADRTEFVTLRHGVRRKS
jgi:hypothetical protein